jgi:hypothetical protein
MDASEKIVEILEGFVPYSAYGRDYVHRGVDFYLKGQKSEALYEFIRSGMGLKGLLYFACRIYLGERENEVYEFIIQNFSNDF